MLNIQLILVGLCAWRGVRDAHAPASPGLHLHSLLPHGDNDRGGLLHPATPLPLRLARQDLDWIEVLLRDR